VTRWSQARGHIDAEAYARRFDDLADSGVHVHGEADLCASLVRPPARVLDAGCGHGRVAVELAGRGYDVTGVDVDADMIAVARRTAPALAWHQGDLAMLDGSVGAAFDLVVAAGNVMPLLAAGTESAAVAAMTAVLVPGGQLVTGFGLDAAHLPLEEAPFGLPEYDRWCAAAGLRLVDRWATWARAPYTGGGYAVSVHTTA